MTWLLAKGALGLVRIGWLIIIACIAALLFFLARGMFDSALDTAADGGETRAVVAGQAQTLDQLGDANVAEQDLRSGGERSAARYDACMRDSRSKRCERYRPDPRPE